LLGVRENCLKNKSQGLSNHPDHRRSSPLGDRPQNVCGRLEGRKLGEGGQNFGVFSADNPLWIELQDGSVSGKSANLQKIHSSDWIHLSSTTQRSWVSTNHQCNQLRVPIPQDILRLTNSHLSVKEVGMFSKHSSFL
jgi:hypothetical protein